MTRRSSIDGKDDGLRFDEIKRDIVFSADGKHIAYIAEPSGFDDVAVIDGKPSKVYGGFDGDIMPGTLALSPDGSRSAYSVKKCREQYVVLDGKDGKHYPRRRRGHLQPRQQARRLSGLRQRQALHRRRRPRGAALRQSRHAAIQPRQLHRRLLGRSRRQAVHRRQRPAAEGLRRRRLARLLPRQQAARLSGRSRRQMAARRWRAKKARATTTSTVALLQRGRPAGGR